MAVDKNKEKNDAPAKRGRQKSEGPTIASVAIAAIKAGKDNKEVLAEVMKAFPEAKTKMASINWYRNKVREEDPSVKTSRDISKERNAAKKAAEKAEKAKNKAAGKGKVDGKKGGADKVDPTK